MVHDNLLVNPATDTVCFRDFVRDKRRMQRLFERFLYNFYRREQTIFEVKRQHIAWENTDGSAEAMECLPIMRTDIVLKSVQLKRKIVIDAKYYGKSLQNYRGKETVHSGHLYQMFSYLKNLAARGGLNKSIEGILLYPTVGKTLDLSYTVHGHTLRICTIDLNKERTEIRRDLLALLDISG